MCLIESNNLGRRKEDLHGEDGASERLGNLPQVTEIYGFEYWQSNMGQASS